ncbi:MAG: NAD(P)H-dependent flavin oxidoreductase [Alphaproteobacteria bacterium]
MTHAALNTRLTEALGCRLPVIQTAMGWVATPDLVVASIEAGAFGFLAAAVMTVQECEQAIDHIQSQSSAPFGVNFHSFQPDADAIVDLVIDRGVKAVSYGRAPSAQMIEKLKAAGVLCIPTIGAGKHAKKAVEMGADIIVCQGGEGGGHTGDTPTWLLLAQTMDAVDVPVAAAGGFKDGRGLAAALAFGADGIAMGTRFLLTSDSPTPEETKARYLKAQVTEIPVSVALDGLPQRMVMNETLAKLEQAGPLSSLITSLKSALAYRDLTGASLTQSLQSAWNMARKTDMTLAQTLMAPNAPMIIQKAMVDGRPEDGVLPSGQVAGLITDLPSCADLLQQIETEATHRLTALGG